MHRDSANAEIHGEKDTEESHFCGREREALLRFVDEKRSFHNEANRSSMASTLPVIGIKPIGVWRSEKLRRSDLEYAFLPRRADRAETRSTRTLKCPFKFILTTRN